MGTHYDFALGLVELQEPEGAIAGVGYLQRYETANFGAGDWFIIRKVLCFWMTDYRTRQHRQG